ncbi:Maf-like protein [Phocaeicola acetigenes]|jgi:septum formation protein|uniref:dTTP/UTP pyrophosphatase n=1 Tax=Phocaeicola acetigenes TaxID=3016083 RepID=A0ABT4PJ99_9BACT|nr:Maf-like protein [Phocaeicola sp. KGMB11183]MCZ8373103.1 Maf-like protein [Phocaeicola sp. KGMB11183]
MLDNLKKYKIILASNSPRRRELLSGLGVDYEVKIVPGIDETYPESLNGEEIPVYIAQEKANAYRASLQPDELVITADTIVYVDGMVLGKPVDEADACRMLRMLSGRTHQVITGVCLTTVDFQKSFASVTEVTFDTLSDEEIGYYVEKYRPMDKAGSYGVQEWIGFVGVTGLKGSYYNVMGLPVQRLYKELKEL